MRGFITRTFNYFKYPVKQFNEELDSVVTQDDIILEKESRKLAQKILENEYPEGCFISGKPECISEKRIISVEDFIKCSTVVNEEG